MSLESEIRKFVVDNFLFGEDGGLGNDDSFLDKGLIDSTGIMEVVAFVEEEYGIEVLDEELVPQNLDSVNNITAFIGRKKA